MLTLTTRPEHLLQTLQQYLGFHTTCKRFEPGRNLIKLPVVHSAPLKYNCPYHRNNINLVVERLNSKTYLMGKGHPSSRAHSYMPNTMFL